MVALSLVAILSAVLALTFALPQHDKGFEGMDTSKRSLKAEIDGEPASVLSPLPARRQPWLWDTDDEDYDGSGMEEENGFYFHQANRMTVRGPLGVRRLSSALASSCPADDVYTCNSGDVICFSQVCDAVADCPDWGDEALCACPEGEFSCDGAVCIENSLVCNGVPDCADGTDEEDCGETTRLPRLCKDRTTYACFCDGVVECLFGEDEHRCKPGGCRPGEWRCRCDGSCIPAYAVCNRRKDCLDGSDERGCVPGIGSWRCRCGDWIRMWQRCDGSRDCRDGSDEFLCPHTHHCHDHQHWLSSLSVRYRLKHLLALFADDDVL